MYATPSTSSHHRESHYSGNITAILATQKFRVVGETDGRLHVWCDRGGGCEERSIHNHKNSINSIIALSGNRFATSSDDGTVREWSLDCGLTQTKVFYINPSWSSLQAVWKGNYFLFDGEYLRDYSSSTHELGHKRLLNLGEIQHAEVYDRRLFFKENRTVHVFDMQSGAFSADITLAAKISELSVSSQYLGIGTESGSISIYNASTLTHLRTYPVHQAAIEKIHLSGNILYSLGRDSGLRGSNPQTGQPLFELPFNLEGKKVVQMDASNEQLTVVRAKKFETCHSIDTWELTKSEVKEVPKTPEKVVAEKKPTPSRPIDELRSAQAPSGRVQAVPIKKRSVAKKITVPPIVIQKENNYRNVYNFKFLLVIVALAVGVFSLIGSKSQK